MLRIPAAPSTMRASWVYLQWVWGTTPQKMAAHSTMPKRVKYGLAMLPCTTTPHQMKGGAIDNFGYLETKPGQLGI